MNERPHAATTALSGARRAAEKVRRTLWLGQWLPVPMVLLMGSALGIANYFLFQNPFLSLFLGLIFAVFAAGQVAAFLHFRKMHPLLRSAEETLRAVSDAGSEPDLQKLHADLERNASGGPLRELILRWTELGLQGRTEGHDLLLEEAVEQRSAQDNRVLSIHHTLNRSTLKLGFLGTLIGIILTFPPMKRAVLGLSESDGELRFIRDIAHVIDGDQYAILSTLIAVGVSILVELLTIQLLERSIHGFEEIQSGINDWHALCLLPAIAKRKEKAVLANELEKSQERMEIALIRAQQTLENHLTELTGAMHAAGAQMEQVVQIQESIKRRLDDLAGYDKLALSMMHAQQTLNRHMAGMTEVMQTSSAQLEKVSHAQALLGRRVTELSEYEAQYRSFLTAKRQAASPEDFRGSR